MVQYALNTQKGTSLHNDDLGDLPAGIAIPISDQQASIARHLVGIVVFDKVAGVNKLNNYKNYYGSKEQFIDKTPLKNYQDFVKECANVTEASEKWKEYKHKHRLND